MGQYIDITDLAPFADIEAAKATEMIADAEAQAFLAARCIVNLPIAPEGETVEDAALRVAKLAGLKSILRGAILRWNEAGSGAFQTTSTQAGPFGQAQTYDTRQVRKGMFWPSEIEQLQGLCASGEKGKAFSIDTVGSTAAGHAPWCSLMFLGDTCSCGANLTAGAFPLYEPY